MACLAGREQAPHRSHGRVRGNAHWLVEQHYTVNCALHGAGPMFYCGNSAHFFFLLPRAASWATAVSINCEMRMPRSTEAS